MHQTAAASVVNRQRIGFSPQTWRRNPLIRLLSSIPFGATLMALTLLYASILSALPQVRGVLEMTEMQAFSHWLFFLLIALLCVSVTIATLTRIRFTLINAGVLTVHSGILTMCLGAFWYFGSKIEGDVLLQSPRVEVYSGARSGPTAQILARAGEKWSTVAPMLGGEISVRVVDVAGAGLEPVQRAVVEAQIGGAPPQRIELAANDAVSKPLGENLSLKLVTFPPERTFYDREEAALYFRPVSAAERRSVPLRGLPYYRERYDDRGYSLTDTHGNAVPSKRTRPEIRLGPISIPTGWFEHWRLPLKVEHAELPFDVEVTGFVPYIAGTRAVAAPNGRGLYPATRFRLELPGTKQSIERTLFALDPVGSILATATPVEFRWAQSAEESAALLRPLAGPHELTIEVLNPPARMTVAVREGQTVAVEGTPYTVTVQQVFPDWPMMSPGFEGASSPAALVEIVSAEKHFTRTVIQRFPQLSQDIDEKGMRRKEGFYDENIRLSYRSSVNGWAMLLCDESQAAANTATFAVFRPDGKVDSKTVKLGEPTGVVLVDLPLTLTIQELLSHAQRVDVPVIEPLETRRPNIGLRYLSAVRLRFTGRGAHAGQSEERWCTFSAYPHEDARPLLVRPPGATEDWEFLYSRQPHDLGGELGAGRLAVTFFPGRESVESWRSDFVAQRDDQEKAEWASVHTNHTYTIGRWTLHQSGASSDHWSWTSLGVGNRRGIWPMLIGCVMITVGCLFAFYVKPALQHRQARRALALAAGRRAAAREARDEQLVEVQEAAAR